jgi:hypothetical protein
VGTEVGDASATEPGPRRAVGGSRCAGAAHWQPFDQRMSNDLRNRFELSRRMKALRNAIRLDNFRLAQHLRMGLAASLRHLEGSLRDDVAQLFEISGHWLRNDGDRHQTKRQIQRLVRRILPRL